MKPTTTVAIEGQVGINLTDIGNKRIFVCENCGQKEVKIGQNKYLKIRNNVNTRSG
ncbi:MAG: hypothetical protein WB511_11995 [Nitrososphaeraceae archaeon]